VGAGEIVDTHILDFKEDLASGGEAGIVEVLQNLSLRVDDNGLSIGEIVKVDAVAAAAEAQFDAAVHQTFRFQSFANSRPREQIDGALLEDPGSHSLFDILAATILNYDRINSLQMQKMRKHEPGRPRADDSDLRTR